MIREGRGSRIAHVCRLILLITVCVSVSACTAGGDAAEEPPGLSLRVESTPHPAKTHQKAELVVYVTAKDRPVDEAKVEIGIQHEEGDHTERVEAKSMAKGKYLVKKTFHQPGVYHLTIYAEKPGLSAIATKNLIVE